MKAVEDPRSVANIVLCCIECDLSIVVPFSVLCEENFTIWMYEHGKWMMSLVSPRGTLPVTMAPICCDCAERVHGKRLMTAAHQELDKRRPS